MPHIGPHRDVDRANVKVNLDFSLRHYLDSDPSPKTTSIRVSSFGAIKAS